MFHFDILKIEELIYQKQFFHFYFLNTDISFNIEVKNMKLSVWFLQIRFERRIIDDLVLFYAKYRLTFCHFLELKLLHFIK